MLANCSPPGDINLKGRCIEALSRGEFLVPGIALSASPVAIIVIFAQEDIPVAQVCRDLKPILDG